ncbi:MAG: CPBP family intramembrane metalloprotease [Paludibacteraceae bacterium]|nr:CPBP family intramembrane metalloprotease [Paludibacteraceae bacterium]
MSEILKHKNVWIKVLFFITIVFLSTLFFIGLWYIIDGGQSIESLKLMQLMQTFGTFLLPCFIYAAFVDNKPLCFLHLDKKIGWKGSLIVVFLMFVAMPCINMLAWLNGKLVLPDFLADIEQIMKSQEENARILTEQFLKADNFAVFLYNIFLMALLPAISEEVLFRGTLQSFFITKKNSNQNVAIWVVAIIFSTIHFQFYGFIPRMLMGALFGYILLWSGSLWLPILAHFTNNALAVVIYYICAENNWNTEFIDSLGTENTLFIGIISLLLTITIIYFLKGFLLNKNK